MDESNIIKKVTDYIEAHLGEDLPLDKIAEHLNYSKYHIARTFARETGSTVYKYIQGRRLTLAAQKLVETEVPIIDIAGEAHYGSQQAFTLAFQRLYLDTPQAYRKKGIFEPLQPVIPTEEKAYPLAGICGIRAGSGFGDFSFIMDAQVKPKTAGAVGRSGMYVQNVFSGQIRGGAAA